MWLWVENFNGVLNRPSLICPWIGSRLPQQEINETMACCPSVLGTQKAIDLITSGWPRELIWFPLKYIKLIDSIPVKGNRQMCPKLPENCPNSVERCGIKRIFPTTSKMHPLPCRYVITAGEYICSELQARYLHDLSYTDSYGIWDSWYFQKVSVSLEENMSRY